MKKSILLFMTMLLAAKISFTQTTAMQFSGLDCYDNAVDLFADLDAGKAVLLHYYMPDCGACPPPAEKIQEMADNIMISYPDMIKGYAFPYQNSTTCAYSVSWVEDNDLPFYTPMDSGAAQVAYYGGFGMPTVVLLGGTDHRVMFSTLSFITSDTTIMRDSILRLFDAPTNVMQPSGTVADFNIYPNPANEIINLSAGFSQYTDLRIELLDIAGNRIALLTDEMLQEGRFTREFDMSAFPGGMYFIRLIAGGETMMKKISIIH